VTEAEFQSQLIETLEEGGAAGNKCLKLDPGTGTIPKGWPDLLVLGQGGVVFWIEVKVEGGTVSPAQRMWMRLLALSGFRVCFCDPRPPYQLPVPMTAEEINAYQPPK
jgi:hypothetical protein